MSNSNNKQNKPVFRTILMAGLLAGTLDILSAFWYGYIKSGTHPATILQYISKTAFRKPELDHSTLAIVTGLLIHYCIAVGWAVIFFALYQKLKIMRTQIIVTAIMYGLFVWGMMNLLLLPLWTDKAFVLNPQSAIINAIILMLAIGLPLSVMAKKYYNHNTKNLV